MNLFGFKKSNPAAPISSEIVGSPGVEIASTDAPPMSSDSANLSDAALIEADDVGLVSSTVVREFDGVADQADSISAEATGISGQADSISGLSDSVSIQAASLTNEILTAEPPRALFPGSYLNGEYEIKEILSRGPINYYLADAGDYGAHDWKLIGERVSAGAQVLDGPESEFFPPATRFAQDEREYAAWDFQSLQSLEEWNAHPNDETYFSVMGQVARGFSLLEKSGLRADLPPSSLFFDGAGGLKCFGFFDARAEIAPDSSAEVIAEVERLEEVGVAPQTSQLSALTQLSALSSRFAKTNLAARSTLRLDDEFGALPFSEEVKTFARALNNGEFAGVTEVGAALSGFAAALKTDVALLTDVGMERELNEDCGLIWKSSRAGHARNVSLELLAVADGMGGHEGGEVASDLTLAALETAIFKRQNLDFSDNSVVLAALKEVLDEVNDAVIRLTENPPYAAMRHKPGATLVCALRVGSRVFVGNVGDSRAYRWNAARGLERLTKDHSYVQDLLDSGSLTESEAWGHPDGSVITSHIGLLRGFKKDTFLRVLRPSDRLVLVSDGVVDTLRDAEIEAIIAANGEVEALCAALVNAANDAGGTDNITVAALVCN